MDYLMRDDSKLTEAQWDEVDAKVVAAAKAVLTGRKFLDVYGPLGSGVQMLKSPDVPGGRRRATEIPMLFADFTLSWRDIQAAERMGIPLSYSEVSAAATDCALQEDRMIFLGNDEYGTIGLLDLPEAQKVRTQDWSEGENAFADVVAGLQLLLENQVYGEKALVVSPDVYAQLQRIQPGTGTLEGKRIAALIEGRVLQTPVLPATTALLLACGEQNMDLALGQDMTTGYLGSSELDHDFRVFETALLRVKNQKAVVVFQS